MFIRIQSHKNHSPIAFHSPNFVIHNYFNIWFIHIFIISCICSLIWSSLFGIWQIFYVSSFWFILFVLFIFHLLFVSLYCTYMYFSLNLICFACFTSLSLFTIFFFHFCLNYKVFNGNGRSVLMMATNIWISQSVTLFNLCLFRSVQLAITLVM